MSENNGEYSDRLFRNLILFSSAIGACLSHAARTSGEESLTDAQLNALRFLYLKHDLVMRDVAQGLGFSFAAGTKTIDRLAQKGLAIRTPRKRDGRQIRVTLTEKGHEVARQIKDEAESSFQQILGSLSKEQVTALNEAVETFLLGFIRHEEDVASLCVACGFEDGLDCRSRGGDCLIKEAITGLLNHEERESKSSKE